MSTLLTAQSLQLDTPFGPLLDNISLTLKKGDRVGLIGHNGCGKSTLLKILDGTLSPTNGSLTQAHSCLLSRVEQHLPPELMSLTLFEAVREKIDPLLQESESWRAETLLASMGFAPADWHLNARTLSGGQHTRLLLARALISQPDVLLLDEPSNHLDLPTMLWLEHFLKNWNGSFILVSHDVSLLNAVTNTSWILRDRILHCFALPCSAAREALAERDTADQQRFQAEQKEIDRVTVSAKRLATWGHVYDNEDLSRKAKQMEKRVDKLKETQTELSAGNQWRLQLKGDALVADRLLELEDVYVRPALSSPPLFHLPLQRLKSGDRVAIIGRNGCGKSSLLRLLWQQFQQTQTAGSIRFHPRVHTGYYDQNLHQLNDTDTLLDALVPFATLIEQDRKMALISAGFPWIRHQQTVSTLSGGERSRLLFVGLTLARYSLLMLDEPTNHLDIEGKEALAETLQQFPGGILLVTHDRNLIAKSCNRFWLVDKGLLSEWHSLDALYDQLTSEETEEIKTEVVSIPEISQPCQEADILLERLVMLEDLLEKDLARKEKHQKPQLQQQWRQEIDYLNKKLAI
ncbi:ABC-F family ATP-binding cassette domain-containing protein [uncultured Cedecea sp.]|uniref:ABC-F family ATP-binding cassette domain-containing protein n=1 Tax=uncultured Cedecea sp. TaxID=988762 RepID=UPI00260BB550|nr:ABC-F family ATP-binding cassette domain-containing protein [uncultured Cedecea sp.]